jgi:hypothetical protein
MAVSCSRSLRDDDVLSLRRRAARLPGVLPASCRSEMRSCIVRERGRAAAATVAGQAPAAESDYSPGTSVSAYSADRRIFACRSLNGSSGGDKQIICSVLA